MIIINGKKVESKEYLERKKKKNNERKIEDIYIEKNSKNFYIVKF
jgi:hypothetical protein